MNEEKQTNEENQTLEECFTQLDGLLESMEAEGVSIEESFSLYERGMKLVGEMHGRLKELSGKVETINEQGQFGEFDDDI